MTRIPTAPKDLWAQLEKIEAESFAPRALEPEKDWFTALQYGERMRLSDSSAREHIAKLRKDGKIVVAGKLRSSVYYKLA